MDFDGAAGFAAFMLSMIGNFYSFPAKDMKLEDSAVAVNIAIIIGVLIVVTKFIHCLLFDELAKQYIEGFHQVLSVIALCYLGKAYMLLSNDFEGISLGNVLTMMNSAKVYAVLALIMSRVTVRCLGLQPFFKRVVFGLRDVIADHPMAASLDLLCMAIGVYMIAFLDLIVGLMLIFLPFLAAIFMYAATVVFKSDDHWPGPVHHHP